MMRETLESFLSWLIMVQARRDIWPLLQMHVLLPQCPA